MPRLLPLLGALGGSCRRDQRARRPRGCHGAGVGPVGGRVTVAYGLGHTHTPPRTRPGGEGRDRFVIPRGESRSFPPPQPLLPAGRPRASPCNPRPPGRSLGCRARGPVARRCGILPASIRPASIRTSPAGCSCRPGAGYGRRGRPPAPFSLSVRSLSPSHPPSFPEAPRCRRPLQGAEPGTCPCLVRFCGQKKVSSSPGSAR